MAFRHVRDRRISLPVANTTIDPRYNSVATPFARPVDLQIPQSYTAPQRQATTRSLDAYSVPYGSITVRSSQISRYHLTIILTLY